MLTQDIGNCAAKADVVVGGEAILKDVPVTTLLFLEKKLIDLHTFIGKMPVLDPADDWKRNPTTGHYSTDPIQSAKTKKLMKHHVLYEATKEHPAQVKEYTEDVVVGYWSTVKHSGAVSEVDKEKYLRRIRALQDAVKLAREEANLIEVNRQEIGKRVFDYLFQ